MIEISNGIATITGDECISKWVRESGQLMHDTNMMPKVLQHINEGDVVIDVGAYIFDHSIGYSDKVGDSGHVYCFEPSDAAYKCLQHNSAGRANVTTIKAAVGSRNGFITLSEVPTNAGMNYISDTDCGKVPLLTIDSYLKLDRLDFIDLDCEGFELDVLQGAKNTIQRCKPKMLIEINDMTLHRQGISRYNIFTWLTENGYIYNNIYPEQGLSDSQLDILAIPIDRTYPNMVNTIKD